jgi:hypothetical protein
MLDFTPVRNKEITLPELTKDLTVNALRALTHEMVDCQLSLIASCTDSDVVFEPEDPEANDSAAATEVEVNRPWTLGHLIVHITASSEEAAFLAAELARGVPYEQRRSRSEVHWTKMTTIDQCRARLEESRRMRLASLETWPDKPCLDNTYTSPYSGWVINAVTRFVFGLRHDDDHLAQLKEVVGQAQAVSL